MIIQAATVATTSGGAEINAITASVLPSTVTDGQIVVVTSAATTTYYFGYDTPDSPANGDIWIHTVDSGGYSFSVGSITVTPGATMQYNGSIWEYRSAYIGVSGEWKLFSTQSPLSSLTWAQIIAIANSGEDCSNFFAVGDEHTLTLTTGEVRSVVIGDFNHNTITGTTKTAAIAFTFKDCYNDVSVLNTHDSNYGGWDSSYMRIQLIPDRLKAFPTELKADNAIKYVDVVASAGSQSTALVTSSDRLRLHSMIELGLSYSYAASGEGTVYAYYAAGNRKKAIQGTNSIYWTRSPWTFQNSAFCCVNASGAADAVNSSAPNGVAPCFDI